MGKGTRVYIKPRFSQARMFDPNDQSCVTLESSENTKSFTNKPSHSRHSRSPFDPLSSKQDYPKWSILPYSWSAG